MKQSWRAESRQFTTPPSLLSHPLLLQIGTDGGAEDPVLRQWWRGRMGLSRPEQLELHQEGGAIEAVGSLGELSELEEEGDSGGEDFWGESSEGEEEEQQGRGRSMGTRQRA